MSADKPKSATNSSLPETLAGNYFVSAYPPFSSWQREQVSELHKMLQTPPMASAETPLGLYVHIPFCEIRCMYCYYLSLVKRTTEQVDDYIDAILQELSRYQQSSILAGRQLEFVYFGGGTPSILTPEQIAKLTSGIQARFPWQQVKEVTFECAPRTVTAEKLQQLKKAGVTRLSLGVQQFNDEILRLNGRVHLISDVERAYELIQKANFQVVNLDLMVGLLGENDDTFLTSLEQIIRMAPDSVTIYQLEIPFNTPLYRELSSGKLRDYPPSWDEKRGRLSRGFLKLQQAQYQIRSAYTAARSARARRFIYQDEQYHGADLLGIGASAFSYLQGLHFQNRPPVDAYLQILQEQQLPVERAYPLSENERMVREFVLQLKLGSVQGRYFQEKFQVDVFERFRQTIRNFSRQGFMQQKGDRLILTLEGLLRVDRLLPNFYLPRHQGVRYS
ncbi:MAG: coproporphyrinogen-III oxidase family protein [bacterium]